MFHVEHFAYSRNKHYKPNNKGYNGRFRKAEGKCQQLYKNKHPVEPNTHKMFHVEHFAYSRNKHYKPNNKGYNGRFRKAEGKCQQLYKNKHSVEPNTHKMFHVEHFSICRWAVVPRGTFCY